MQKVDVAPELTMPRSEATLDRPLAGAPAWDAAVQRGPQRLLRFFARLTDTQLVLAVSTVLFACSAWPLALTEVPPYQDLPNHLAAVMVIRNPEEYPEFVFNGFFKTNSALFTWLYVAGRFLGEYAAVKLFSLAILALNAFAFPRIVLELTNRRRMIVASFFIWPMVHNWFVCMGMLDFALGVPLALLSLVVLGRQRLAPTWTRAGAIVALTLLAWYAHVFPVMVVLMLVGIHVLIQPTWRARWEQAVRLFPPLLPAIVVVVWALYSHMTEPGGAMTGYVEYRKLIAPWELAYNIWAEWSWGFTWFSASSLVPCVLLALLAIGRARERIPFFSPLAFFALTVLYCLVPYTATNWFHVNSRLIPFLCVAALLRLPDHLPRKVLGLLGVCGVLYSVGMGADFVRLDQDRLAFTAGIDAIPQGSRLLPLVFKQKATSENTKSVLHAWGFYATAKHTATPLLFAHSRSFPVMYRDPPDPQFNHLLLESFAPTMGTSHWMCGMLRSAGIVMDDCEEQWRERWTMFWNKVTPAFDHVLFWDAPQSAIDLVPSTYKLVFHQDRLRIYERIAAVPTPQAQRSE